MIGDDVMVTVVEAKDGSVSLGIDAPRDVQAHRAEIHERIRREAAAGRATTGSESDSQRQHGG